MPQIPTECPVRAQRTRNIEIKKCNYVIKVRGEKKETEEAVKREIKGITWLCENLTSLQRDGPIVRDKEMRSL